MDVRASRVQDVNSLAGKVLRIDPITGKGLPSIPYYSLTNDPDANSAKVYQMGIRNSFRIAVDKSSGRLFCREVGWSSCEEINSGGPGANFGWPYYEGDDKGSAVHSGYGNTAEGQLFASKNVAVTAPLVAINHARDDIDAIVLGDKLTSTYYGQKYQGDLFHNHLGKGYTRHVSFDSAGNVESIGEFPTAGSYVVSIQEGPDGFFYYCKLVTGVVGRRERR